MTGAARSEKSIQTASKKVLEKAGAWSVKADQGRGRRGVPDFLCCYLGVFIALEFKKEKGGKLGPMQQYTRDKIRKAGGICETITHEDQVTKVLEDIDIARDVLVSTFTTTKKEPSP